MSIIESNIESICQLCKKHHVDSMSVFGSVLTDRFDANSDIDFLGLPYFLLQNLLVFYLLFFLG